MRCGVDALEQALALTHATEPSTHISTSPSAPRPCPGAPVASTREGYRGTAPGGGATRCSRARRGRASAWGTAPVTRSVRSGTACRSFHPSVPGPTDRLPPSRPCRNVGHGAPTHTGPHGTPSATWRPVSMARPINDLQAQRFTDIVALAGQKGAVRGGPSVELIGHHVASRVGLRPGSCLVSAVYGLAPQCPRWVTWDWFRR